MGNTQGTRKRAASPVPNPEDKVKRKKTSDMSTAAVQIDATPRSSGTSGSFNRNMGQPILPCGGKTGVEQRDSLEINLYQSMKGLCSTQSRAYGPSIDADFFFSDPVLQENSIEYFTNVSRKKYSCYVSELLDRLGYNYSMIKYRQQAFDEMDAHFNRLDYRPMPFRKVVTGGKGEGTALFCENDLDSMHIVNDVICADYPQHFIHKNNITLFQTERQEASPGYARLKLIRFGKTCFANEIRESLFMSETGSHYLSSQFFTNAIKADLRKSPGVFQELTFGDTSGPSTPGSNKLLNMDIVTCFACFCPDILENWLSRPRRHGWPSPLIVHEISLLDAHVVPVGLKGSQNMYKEWRISYSLAELHLMRSLNETQLKVYILLKKITKRVLNQVCEEMTSYIMKNVVFWVCEANGIGRFSEDKLMDRLFDCIKYLRSCVTENNLASYMIPDKNLFAGRLEIQQRNELINLLGDILNEGGRMLLRCDRIRDAMLVMYKVPEMFREFSEKRDKVENLTLMRQRIMLEESLGLKSPDMTLDDLARQLRQNDQHCDLVKRTCLLIQFDEKTLSQMGKSGAEIDDLFSVKLNQLLS